MTCRPCWGTHILTYQQTDRQTDTQAYIHKSIQTYSYTNTWLCMCFVSPLWGGGGGTRGGWIIYTWFMIQMKIGNKNSHHAKVRIPEYRQSSGSKMPVSQWKQVWKRWIYNPKLDLLKYINRCKSSTQLADWPGTMWSFWPSTDRSLWSGANMDKSPNPKTSMLGK